MNTAKNLQTFARITTVLLAIAAATLLFPGTSNADIFNDLINIQIDNLTEGIEEEIHFGVTPFEFELELEHTGAAGFDVDIVPAEGCDFFLRISHFSEVPGIAADSYDWIISDIHMRTTDGDELFAKITGVELPSPGTNMMPTTAIHFTDWVVAVETGPYLTTADAAANDYLVRVAVVGDVNNDCQINLLDVNPFVDLLTDGGYSTAADVNQDGALNLLDVSEFINLLSE